MKLSREFYQPSKYESKIVPKDVKAEIYLIDEKHAMAFGGRRSRPDFNYLFRSQERRDEYVAKYIDDLRESQEYASKRRADRNKPHTLEVDDILYSSWGYDQTNVDFYQVVEVVGKCTVIIREIAHKTIEGFGGPSESVVAVKGSFIGEAMTKRSNSTNCVRIASYASASLWNGEPKHQTGFGWGH